MSNNTQDGRAPGVTPVRGNDPAARPWYALTSIRTRLLVILLSTALGPLLATGLITGSYGRTLLEKSIGSNLHRVAHAVIQSLDERIEQRRQTLAALARMPAVRAAASDGSAAFAGARQQGVHAADARWRDVAWVNNPIREAAISDVLRSTRDVLPDLVEIFLTDRNGWVVGATNKTEDYLQSDEAWWMRATGLGCGHFHVDDLHYDPSADAYVTAIGIPVCDANQVVGVLRAGLAFSRIIDIASRLDLALDDDGAVWIVKQDGKVVVDGDRSGGSSDVQAARPVLAAAQALGESKHGYLEVSVRGVPSVVGYSVSTGAGEYPGLGWTALVVQPTAHAYAPVVAFQRAVGLVSLVLLLGLILVGLRVSRSVARPIHRSADVARAIAAGDLCQAVHHTGQWELDRLAGSLNDMTANLRAMVGSIRGTAVEVEDVSRSLARGSSRVVEGSDDQITQVAQTNRLMKEARASVEGISSSVQEMVAATASASESLVEMETVIGEVVESTGTLASGATITADRIQEMVSSIQQVDAGVVDLRKLAEATAESVSQMDTAIQSVEHIAARTAKTTTKTAADAETGRVAVERTLAGMVEIERASVRTGNVISGLTGQIGKIGSILEVIDDVTEQTNLLALNASILAAQAGEHGRGFAVVAEEIKHLAERTAESTGDITRLVRALQEGSDEAARAVADGNQHIVNGVDRAREAGEALLQILDGARASSEMVTDIAAATGEHASQSHHVAAAMNQLHGTVSEMAQTIETQAEGCTAMLAASAQMQAMTQRVEKAIVEQQQRSRMIARSVETIAGMARSTKQASGRQRDLSEEIATAIDRIEGVSGENVAAIAQVDAAIRILTGRAEKLRTEVAAFHEADDPPAARA
ncbi:MAG: methyl-accepting chemotaxis protein [Acidobacteriota bacterium]